MTQTFRYVLHDQVRAFASQGWIAHDSLKGTHHGQYSTLMEYVGANRTAHGASMRPGSHHAPYPTRRDSSFNLPSASSAPFERSQIAKALIDVGALLFVSFYLLLWIAVILGLIPLSIFVLLFVQL